MASVGTATFSFDNYRNAYYTISGIAATGDTPSFRSLGFFIGSYQATGLTASGLTAQLQGSNDGTNFYDIDASARTTDGIYGLVAEPSGYSGIVPAYYRWVIAGAYSSGSVTLTAFLASTFG